MVESPLLGRCVPELRDHVGINAHATRDHTRIDLGLPAPPSVPHRASVIDRFLDTSLLGYTRLGFVYRIEAPPRERMEGRTVVVTGATSGLGRATATALAGLGANVIGVARDAGRADAVRKEIVAKFAGARVRFELADVSCMAEVVALAARLEREPAIHVLVNNAGVLENTRRVTHEGIELTFATNLLGHYVLTEALLPKLASSAPARVINVSSGGMYSERIRPDDLETERMPYDGPAVYARTKRGQVILTEIWAERMRSQRVVVNAMHPGWADTPGVLRALPRFHAITERVLRSPEEGADTIVWLASAKAAAETTGGFFHDRAIRPTHRLERTRETAAERAALVAELERRRRTAISLPSNP